MSERKTILARLLANENIQVVRTNDSTAWFDVDNRVLGLPLWKDVDENEDLGDLFVGHETGHALYTPGKSKKGYQLNEGEVDWVSAIKSGIPKSYLNVVEDVRIEKAVLQTYPGLLKNFLKGYEALWNRGFFSKLVNGVEVPLTEEDISTLGFMNRLNLFAKMRGLVKVPFTKEEQKLVDMVFAVETWGEAVAMSRFLAKWVKEKQKEQEQNQEQNVAPASAVGESDESQQGEEDNESDAGESSKEMMDEAGEGDKAEGSDETGDDSDETEKASSGDEAGDEETNENDASDEAGDEESDSEITSGGEGGEDAAESADEENLKAVGEGEDADEVSTSDVLENAMKEMAGEVSGDLVSIAGPDDKLISDLIPSMQEMLTEREAEWVARPHLHSAMDDRYNAWMREARNSVGAMVREFEMRKAAWQQRRGWESTKGSLDVTKLHKYRYDDKLFKQMVHVPDGKNHGVFMVVDYSGSMGNIIPHVVKQLIILAMFCKRVNIPFEAYGFTSNSNREVMLKRENARSAYQARTPYQDRFGFNDEIIFPLLNSKLNGNVFNSMLKLVFAAAHCYDLRTRYENMGGTPLYSSLVMLLPRMLKFKSENSIERLTLINLTDGESNAIEKPDYGSGQKGYNSAKAMVINYAGGIKLTLKNSYGMSEDGVMKGIRETLRKFNVKIMNYHIQDKALVALSVRESFGNNKWVSVAVPPRSDSRKEYNKNGVTAVDNIFGYDRIIIIDENTLRPVKIDGHNYGAEPLSVAHHARTMADGLRSKKNARTIAQKVAEIVA